jgi:YD repeat-containing protein
LLNIYKIDASNSLWQAEYFDGLGRVVQTQSQGESGHTIIAGTTSYNSIGQVDKKYVSQDIPSSLSTYYVTGIGNWKYISYSYDGMGRVVSQTNADTTTVGNDYSTAWQNLVSSPGTSPSTQHKKRYYYNAFQRLTRVDELQDNGAQYAITQYTYDVPGNLTDVYDNSNNHTHMVYDWLGRKTNMSDPDMRSWSYTYDNNGSLQTQTDARGRTISMTYDSLNRLTGKTYPAGLLMTNVSYTYDSTASGNYGKGKRTSITDALGTNSTTEKYDNRGRLIQETKIIDAITYSTSYTYNGADRIIAITYPSGETVRQNYNGRGLPYILGSDFLSGDNTANLVTSTLYNALGITDLNLNNSTRTTYGYYGPVSSTGYDTTGDYYGRLWEIRTTKQPDGTPVLQDIQHTWDAAGNLTQRNDEAAQQKESFYYDFLDRLISPNVPVTPLSSVQAIRDAYFSYMPAILIAQAN